MKCDLHSIIGILHEVESCETNDPIVYTNGGSYNEKTGNKNPRVKEFPKIYANSLCIRDYGLADVQDLGNKRGVTIERITPKGSRFLVKASILEAIERGKQSERELAELLELPPDTINVYIKQLEKEDFITALDGYASFEPERKEYVSCVLNPKGKTAFSDPSFLAEESNIDMSNTVNNNLQGSNIGNFANEVKENARQQANQYNYASEQKQTLAQAASEIQKLLKHLERTNPTATEEEKIIYVNDETSSGLKRRTVSALKAGVETGIEEFLDNPYVNVGKAIVKAWIKSE